MPASFSRLSLLSPTQPSFTLSESTPLLFLFKKGQASHEYQQNRAYQIVEKLSNSPFVNAGQGDPVWGVGSQKSVKESERALFQLLGVTQEGKATQY